MKRVRTSLFFVAVVGLLGMCGLMIAFSGAGSGTESAPYIITTVEQLQEMNDDLAACYELDCDIDASATQTWNGGAGFEPVGNPTDPFTGIFDGRGHVITGLFIHRPSTDFVGLFGLLDAGAEISNVGLADAEITGYSKVGALVGYNNNSAISNSSSGGNVTGTESGSVNSRIGGLVGINSAGSSILQCYSIADVTSGAWQVGGLSGYNGHGSVIIDCYATGNVTGNRKVGGLVGDNCYPEGGYVRRCYSTGRVTGGGGGLIGYNYNGGVTYDSYWDVQASGKSSSYGGIGKTTAQMMQQSTFVSWDFVNIWNIFENQGYPFLRIEYGDLIRLEIVGPNEVAENFIASYKAIAHYDNNKTRNVTNSALWAVEPNTTANIDENGVLTTKDVVNHQSATILASYTEEDVAVDAEKTIDILAICPTGTALQFDGGNDYVSVPDDASLNITGDITISAWVYFTQGGSNQGIVTKCVGGGRRNNPFDFRTQTSAEPQLTLVRADAIAHERVYSSRHIPLREWHHVLVRVENKVPDFYVNGVITGKYADTTFTRTPTGNTKPLLIGKRNDGLSFNGLIDEVAIYNRALSAEEIVANMHTRLAGDEPGLVGYWDFDEGGGQIVYDLSVSGNDGQLGSTPEVDSSDPAWAESDAPVGICSLYQIATLVTDGAVERKTALIEEVLAALAYEWTAYEALEEWLESGDYGDLNKGDIVTAKQKIHSATQHEGQQSIGALDKSVEKLKDALRALGYEPEPPVSNQPPNVNITGGVREVKAVDIITNGSFETGDFTGWGTKDIASPFYTLDVRVAGTSPWGYGLFLAEPTDGVYAATHGFDGGGPDTIEIFQDVTIPAGHSAILTFDWRAGWDFTFGIPATVRILDLAVEPNGGGNPLSTTNILTADPAVNMVLLDTGPNSDSIDLSAFAGSSIRINFLSTIPDNFSGPAHLQIDNVALDVEPIKLSVIAAIKIEQAIAKKYEMLEAIDEMLEEEWAAYEALEELLESEDYEDLDKGDIVTAKQKIHSAIQHEEQAIDALEKSIEKLEDALRALGYEPPPPPGQAINPNPANGTTDVGINADLSWTAGPNAVSHDVYFGTNSPGTFRCNQTATTFDPGTMSASTTYYWRIDEVNPSGTTTGTVWSFTTGSPPGQATNPNPADGARWVGINADLSWTAGSDAVSHDVYFGTTSPGMFRGNQTAATFDPGTMAMATTYYWRIDEVNAGGTTTGTVWSFTTGGPR